MTEHILTENPKPLPQACTTADASTSQKLLGMVRDVAPRLSAKAVTSIVNQVRTRGQPTGW